MYNLATISVFGVTARTLRAEPIPTGLIGGAVYFVFDELWEGLTKNVTFKGTAEVTILNVQDYAWLPKEVIAEPRIPVKVGITGVNAEGTEVIPTLWADLGATRPAAPTDLGEGIEDQGPVPPVWAQILAQLNKFRNSLALVDQETGLTYKICVSNGDLTIENVDLVTDRDSATLVDQITGEMYKIYVSNGELMMEEGEV